MRSRTLPSSTSAPEAVHCRVMHAVAPSRARPVSWTHILCLGLFLFAGGCMQFGEDRDVDAVRAAFENYHAALARRDGKAAATAVDSTTLAYYDEARRMAVTAPPDRVHALPLTQRMQVLTLRHLLDYESLQKMDGAAVLAYLVSEGWSTGPGGQRGARLGAVTVSDDVARAQYEIRGEPTPLVWTFVREHGDWKLNLSSMMPLAEQGIAQVVQRTGLSEDDFIIRIIEGRTGRPVTADLWAPPGYTVAR